jgi:hypothetical protein
LGGADEVGMGGTDDAGTSGEWHCPSSWCTLNLKLEKARPNDATKGPCLDLMVHHHGPIMPEGATPVNAVPAPEFLGAMDFGVIGSSLPGSPGSPSPPVSWGQVENNVL